MAAVRTLAAIHPTVLATGAASVTFALLGLVAFNLGYVWLYIAFLPLLCISTLLSVEVSTDLFLSLLLFAVASTLLYAVGLFALPLVSCGIVLSLPVILALRKWGVILLPTAERESRSGGRALELCGLLVIALFARYVLYRAGGGTLPLRIGEVGALPRFLISEIGGWGVFALGYGMRHRIHYGARYSPEAEFTASLPSVLATGLFLISPHVAIMTLGLNIFGVTGLYVGSLPVGAAHILMRTLTLRRLAIERQNLRLQQMNVELARNERLAAIGEMSSAISHQLLQKVGLVGLQSALLRDALLEEAVATDERLREGRERVEQLDESIADLNTTLSDLLIFSKDVALHLDSCLVSAVLHEAADEARAVSATRGVSILCRCDTEETPAAIDRIKLKQALLNLLTNAVEASPTSAQVDLVLWEDSERVQISVTDHGPGVPANDQERIFSPFFSTKAQGTGLGLTFAQKIVALHGGTVTAKNNPHGGATFVVELPRPPILPG